MHRVFIEEKISDLIRIRDEDEVRHIGKVLRLQTGEEIEVVDAEGKEFVCRILKIGKKEVEAEKLKERDEVREIGFRLQVYQGIPKGQKMELIVQKLTEIGVTDIHPVAFERCVRQMKEEKEDKKIKRYEKIALEAAKQSKRTKLPKIHPVKEGKRLPEILSENELNLLFYENEEDLRLGEILQEARQKRLKSIGVLIGPEGGLTKKEAEELEEAGCRIVSLGRRILRTETAAITASSIVVYEMELRGGTCCG
ncbi:MAG: RsmE family RNA methyltransferase [Peptostreptococcaceae bacterium]|nr:RsmE family RNA methyltransferase [Peptostreptococcaceae bacterium]